LRAAAFRPDSADSFLGVASVTIVGDRGDSIVLRVDAAPGLLEGLGAPLQLAVRANDLVQRYSLSTLRAGTTVYRFSQRDTVLLSYEMSRQVRGVIASDDFRIVQFIGNAQLLRIHRPWVLSAITRAPDSPAGCVITEASQVVCDDTILVSPFVAPPENIGGTFTSREGTGQSIPITITLNPSVRLVTTKIYDPTWAGNTMVAYDSAGNALGSVSFTYSGQYGVNHPNEQTIARRGIRRIDLTPPDMEYVSYDVSFEVDTCPSTGDSILDSPQVQTALKVALDSSNPNATAGTGVKKEHGGLIWRMPDGSFLAQIITDPTISSATECTYNLTGVPTPPPDPSAYYVAIFHTHPYSLREAVYQCPADPGEPLPAQTRGDGRPIAMGTPDLNGGGSNEDWDAASQFSSGGYVINKSGRVYKFTPGTVVGQRRFNTNKWEWKKPSTPGCMTHTL
jgi:hypothetical protein